MSATAALTLDDTANERFWNVVGGSMPGDQRVEIAVGVNELTRTGGCDE
jgi:hypothetical protein